MAKFREPNKKSNTTKKSLSNKRKSVASAAKTKEKMVQKPKKQRLFRFS